MMKRILIMIVVSLLLTACASNSNGILGQVDKNDDSQKINESENPQPEAPGTLPEVSDLTQPDQSQVGKMGTYSFSTFNQASFGYFYNKDTQKERLVLIGYPSVGQKQAELIVLETGFGGFDGLKKALVSSFEAKLLACLNISFEEGMYAHNAPFVGSGMESYYNDGESVNLATAQNNSARIQFYLGSMHEQYPASEQGSVVNELSSGKYLVMLANMYAEESKQLLSRKAVYDRIFERFELQEIVSVE